MTTVVVVGNPNPRSRTLSAAQEVARRLTGADADATLELAELGSALLEWGNAEVAAAKQTVLSADLVVVASPTYKGTYTGLLKLFLDQFGADELVGVTAVPLMLGGDQRHSLAPEVSLRPVLVEIGLACPARGLFLVDSAWDDPAVLDAWATTARRQFAAVGSVRLGTG